MYIYIYDYICIYIYVGFESYARIGCKHASADPTWFFCLMCGGPHLCIYHPANICATCVFVSRDEQTCIFEQDGPAHCSTGMARLHCLLFVLMSLNITFAAGRPMHRGKTANSFGLLACSLKNTALATDFAALLVNLLEKVAWPARWI